MKQKEKTKPLEARLEEAEKQIITDILKEHGGHTKCAAIALNISEFNLRKRLKTHNLLHLVSTDRDYSLEERLEAQRKAIIAATVVKHRGSMERAAKELEISIGSIKRPSRRNGGNRKLKNAIKKAEPTDLRITMAELEKLLIIKALNATNGNVIKASQLLKIGQATVYRKIKAFKIDLKGCGMTISADEIQPFKHVKTAYVISLLKALDRNVQEVAKVLDIGQATIYRYVDLAVKLNVI